MSVSLLSEVKVSLAWLFKDAENLSTVVDSSLLDYHHKFTDGITADKADLVWHDQRTLAAGASEDLVLSALDSPLFANTLTIALAKVKALLLVNTATTPGEDLEIGGAPSDEWQGPFAASGDKLVIPADSSLLLVNKKSGWPAIASSSDKLRIANVGGGSITYKIAILGTSV
jgi:hypothetical protein